MKRAVLKRLTAFIASILVVTIASPNFVYSVKASAHEGEAGIAIEASAPEETEAEKAKAPKTESDKKPAKETKKATETKAEPEETKAKETEAKEPEAKAEEPKATEAKSSETKSTEAKATEAKSSEKAEETKAAEPEQTKESEKETPAETKASETEQTKETAEESKETAPSESAVETEPTETAEPSESKETEETQPSESEPAETSESSESSEETEPSETSETTAAETAPAANIKVAESAEEFISLVASLPESYRLIIDTNADLSSLKGAKGVYYEGSYVLVFDGVSNYDAALKYLSNKKISYSIDGSVELCGSKFIVNDVKINPNAKTKIAIIDTGSSLANEKVSVMGDKGDDKNGHGTSMASTVLAQTEDAYIISIKAIDDNGTGKVADVYAALQYAIEADCKVVLMAISLRDLGQYEAFKSLIADAISKDIKIVASAGNNGTDASKYIPAGLKDVLTAGAMDENGVKLPKSNYGKSVEYYVVAESTSEAAAVLAGKVIAGRADELATTCKMSATDGKDDNNNKFKINEVDIASKFSTSLSGDELFKRANGFCVFAETFIQSNHMEGTVATNTLRRNTTEVMDLSADIINKIAEKSNFYFYINDLINDHSGAFSKELLAQGGTKNAPLYLGPDLVYVHPVQVQTDEGTKSQIVVDGNTIVLDADYSNNNDGYVLYSKKSGKVVTALNNRGDLSKGGEIDYSTKINFDGVLTKIASWSDGLYNKKDLDLKNYTPGDENRYTIRLHDGINYINIGEEVFLDHGFNFVSSYPNSSIVINVVDTNGDGVVNLTSTASSHQVQYNGVGNPMKEKETLEAATHILVNFKSSIKTVNMGKKTDADTMNIQLGTLLAPGADINIKSTHDGCVVAKSFENIDREIHQSGFAGFEVGDVTYNKLSIIKNYYYTGTSTEAPHGSETAKFKLTGDDYSSEQSSGYVWKNLRIGTYTLTETSAPNGFTKMQPLTVTVGTDWKITVTDPNSQSSVTLPSAVDENVKVTVNNYKDQPTTFTVNISKVDAANSKELAGAQLKITNAPGNTFDFSGVTAKQNGADAKDLSVSSSAVSFTSVADYKTVVSGLEAGQYILTETTAPGGYEKAEAITFTVGANGNVSYNNVDSSDTVVMEDKEIKKYEVSISKQDMMNKGPELPGASMKLTAATGTTVDWSTARKSGPAITANGQSITWTSADSPLKLNLPDGTYTLEETATLKIGDKEYETITTSTFVMKDGKVTEQTDTSSDDTVTFTGTDGRTVTAFDTPKTTPVKTYEVSISKQDMMNKGPELPGASMKLTAATGTTVDWSTARKSGPAISANGQSITWTSADSPLKLNLPDGTYTLEETATLKIGDKEYETITTSTFVMKDGKVTEQTDTSSDDTVTFTGTDGRTVTAFDKPVAKTYEVSISKQDMMNKGPELPGASMKLTAATGTTVDWSTARKSGPAISANGQSITWTSADSPLKLNLPDGTYTLEETATLKIGDKEYETITTSTFVMKDGKVTEQTDTSSDDTVTFTGTDGRTVTAFDKPVAKTYEVSISKQDMMNKGPELKGASMKLTSKDDVDWDNVHVSGPAVTGNGKELTWKSGDEPLKLNLPDGTYTLEETATLKIGDTEYETITTSTFVMKDGKVTEQTDTSSDDTVTFTGTDGRTVTAFDTPKTTPVKTYEVSISKQDMMNKGPELKGASMKLTSKDDVDWDNVHVSGPAVTGNGKELTWTSGDEPLKINLPDGTYTLEETATLKIGDTEYETITTSTFVMKDGKVTEQTDTSSDDTVTFTGTDGRTVTAFDTPKTTPVKTYEVSISKQDMMNKGPELPGASMKLTSKDDVDWDNVHVSGPAVTGNGKELTWTSGDEPLKINLPDGTYTLEETATLKIGDTEYETITTSTFVMKDGKVTEQTDTSSDDTVTFTGTDGRTVTAFDTPKTTPVKTYEVSISKQDMMNKGPELKGASMKLTSKDDVDWDNVHVSGPAVTGNGKELTWKSGDEPLKLNLPDGTYTLEETATLKIGDTEYETITTSTFVMKDGKVTEQTDTSSDDTVTFTGTDGRTVTAFDKPVTKTYEVSISKQDMMNKGPELPGASMKLTAATGTTVDWSKARVSGPAITANGQSITWTSADSPLKINLPDGTYTLEETATLKIGDTEYETITTSTFVMKDGKVTEQTDTSSDDTVTFTGTDGRTVTAFDTPKTIPVDTYEVSISKKDIADKDKDNAEELPGAKMKITATGTTVVDWSTAHVSGPAITANGKSITWTSGSSPLKVNLPNGTYVLEENGAPAGYLEITATNFEVKDGKVVPGSTTSSTVAINGNTNTITAFDELRLTDTVFSKKDFAKKTDSSAEELEGATMKLTALSGPASEWSDSDWDAARKSGPTIRKILNEDAINWTSGTSQLKLALPDGEYELMEQTPPSDYQTITKLTFKIEKGEITGTTDETAAIDNDNKVITAFDKAEGAPAEVYISKKDMADKGDDNANELVGAEMQLTAINGKAVDWDEDTWKAAKKEGPEVSKVAGQRAIKWTSSTTQLKIALPDGKYELKETGTPAGYNVITTTTFEISGGKVQPLTTETVVADENTNTITAFDSAKTYKVQLSKEDIAHNQVASATLSVTSMDGHDLTNVKVSRNGTAVDTTLSSDKHTISFVTGGNTYSEITGLRMGKYQLKETVTPEKYLTADAITFEIKDDGSLYINSVKVTGSMVVMIDRADPAYFTPVTINGLDKEDRTDVPDIEIVIKSKTPTVDLTGIKPTGGDVTDQGEKTITIKTKGGPVELSLPDGEYTITPKGPSKYDTVPSTPFKVEGGKVVPTGTPGDIEITDHNITILLPKSNPGKKTSKGSVTATGVGISATNVAGAVLVSAALTAMGICIVVFKKKKKEY